MKKSEMTMKFMAQDIEYQEDMVVKLKEYLVQDTANASSKYDFSDIARKASELASEIQKLETMKENYFRVEKIISYMEEGK